MIKAIVFGAGGQVGSDLVPMLLDRGTDVTLVDNRPFDQTEGGKVFARYSESRGRPGWQDSWRTFDATDSEPVSDLIDEVRPAVIYHLAALLSAKCEDMYSKCWRLNMALFETVLEKVAAVTAGSYRPMLIWPSSIAAFGPPPGSRNGYRADNEYPLLPTTMYGVTKVACETLGTYYAERNGVDFRSVRFPGLLNTAAPGSGSSDYANAMYFGATDGSGSATSFVRPQARIPFMYMEDAVRALIQLAAADESKLTRRVYNITAFAAPSASELADSIIAEVPGFTVRYEPDGRERNVDSWPDDFDDGPARRDWGWQPEVTDLETMTRKLLADLRALRPDP